MARVRTRRTRSATESLLSITLVLEVLLVFFAALAAYALREVPPATALIGGAVFILLLLVCSRIVGTPVGLAFGWALQAALVATGIILPLMFLIGAGFLALWTYCYVKGRTLDRARHEMETAQ